MLPTVASYFSPHDSAGGEAVNTTPQRLQRSFWREYTFAPTGGWPINRTSTPGRFVS